MFQSDRRGTERKPQSIQLQHVSVPAEQRELQGRRDVVIAEVASATDNEHRLKQGGTVAYGVVQLPIP